MILCCLSRCICGDLPSPPALVSSLCSGTGSNHTVRVMWGRQKGKMVRYTIDRMTMADVPRVVEIERLAYPSTWPPSAYRKELQDNRWAHYIVLRDRKIFEERATVAAQEPEKPRRIFPLSLLPNRSTVTMPTPELASIV